MYPDSSWITNQAVFRDIEQMEHMTRCVHVLIKSMFLVFPARSSRLEGKKKKFRGTRPDHIHVPGLFIFSWNEK